MPAPRGGYAMIALALLWLAASFQARDVTDATYTIPAGEWRYVAVDLTRSPAMLTAEFKGSLNSDDVRIAVLREEELVRLREDRPHGILSGAGPGPAGNLQCYISDAGRYAVVVENRSAQQPASVWLRVHVDSTPKYAPRIQHLSRGRQLIVILASFSVFFGVVTWSARKLLSNMRK